MDSLLGLGSSDEDEPGPTSTTVEGVDEEASARENAQAAAYQNAGGGDDVPAVLAGAARDDLGLGSDSDSEGEGSSYASTAVTGAATNGVAAHGTGGVVDPSKGESERASKNYTFTIPNLPRPRPSSSVHMTRLPNVLGFREEEFTPEAFAESEDGRRFHRNLALWRYKRDDSGDVMRDADNNPIRCGLLALGPYLPCAPPNTYALTHPPSSAAAAHARACSC